MTELSSLYEAIEETTAAAVTGNYGLNETEMARLERRARLLSTHDGWALAGLQRAFLDVAVQHAAECGADECGTCASIRYGLASTLAGLRVLVEDAEKVAARRLRMVA